MAHRVSTARGGLTRGAKCSWSTSLQVGCPHAGGVAGAEYTRPRTAYVAARAHLGETRMSKTTSSPQSGCHQGIHIQGLIWSFCGQRQNWPRAKANTWLAQGTARDKESGVGRALPGLEHSLLGPIDLLLLLGKDGLLCMESSKDLHGFKS